MKNSNYDTNIYDKDITSLQKEITELEEEYKYKTALFSRRNEIANLPYNSKYSYGHKKERIGSYDLDILKKLPDFQEKWEKTIYVTHQSICEAHSTDSLNPEYWHYYFQTSFPVKGLRDFDGVPHTIAYIICILEGIFPTEEGDVLIISDPFATVKTIPVTNENHQKLARKNIGNLLYMTIYLRKGESVVKCVDLKECPYSLYYGQLSTT